MITSILHFTRIAATRTVDHYTVVCAHGGRIELQSDMLAFDFHTRCQAAGLTRNERGLVLDLVTSQDPAGDAYKLGLPYVYQP